jgi:Glycosyl transferase family 11
MQIVVRQTSGLGNQLFQYAAGRYLAKKYRASLRIAHELTKNIQKHGAHRPVMLQKFALSAKVGRASAFDRFVLSTRPQLEMASGIVRAASRIQVIREATNSSTVRPTFPVAAGSRVVYIRGYWQDAAIVGEVEDELRREISLIEPLGARSLEVQARIRAAANPVSIHLRRGDYLTVFGTSAVLPMEYYKAAIELVSHRFPDSTFFVFSDDAAHARESFLGDPRFVVVDHNDAHTAHEDMVLMASCRQHIIANSTFSWWGAWLNPRSDKQVIAPSRWLGVETAKTTIASDSWTLVDI